MTLLFFVLIVIACFLLSFFVLVQNPKGGGLAGTIGGFNNQYMGVKQTTDFLEKGTWFFATIIGVLCIISVLFISKGSASQNSINNMPTTTNAPATQQAPASTPAPAQATPQQATPKK